MHIFLQTDISLTSSTVAGTSKSALKAHKVVLSASSQYFRDQLQVSTKTTHDSITIHLLMELHIHREKKLYLDVMRPLGHLVSSG